ncbi:Farnesyl pyrophosphate synthase [Taenia crassiceps]|uniref:Farnesyl pyrophosphate synthase n=1 Tax=Taenia crassiceps TaxID=6207 RepID=A0ABR4QMV2_9CEST
MLGSLTSDFDSYFESVLNTLYGPLSCDLVLVRAHFTRVQAAFLVHDDLIDGSSTRRGQVSWGLLQQREGRGLIGINDGLHLYLSAQQLLMASFHSRPHPRCLEILKLFSDCANYTCFGQALDILGSCLLQSIDSDGTSPCGTLVSKDGRLRDVTISRFNSIAKWKTSYYSFVLPVAAGMLLADVKSSVLFSNAELILLKIGEYFQVQDDFLDVYGEENVTGKVGTDIEEGKCSWLIAKALENASSEQRDTLSRNYGLKDPNCVNAVRKVFGELNLPSLYSAYEDQTRTHILEVIDSLSTDKKDEDFTDPAATKLPRQLFVEILNIFYRRKK